jgi:hypothetical protein
MGIWHYYYDKSRCYFSINRLMTASRITIAALLLSFGALAIVPTIHTVSALESDTPLANNTNNVANNHSIGKQTAGSQEYKKSNPNKNNNDTTTNSDHSLREYSIILPFPISTDNDKKTQTSLDRSINNDDKGNASPVKNNNNDNKDSKLKDTTKKTPLLLPFP